MRCLLVVGLVLSLPAFADEETCLTTTLKAFAGDKVVTPEVTTHLGQCANHVLPAGACRTEVNKALGQKSRLWPEAAWRACSDYPFQRGPFVDEQEATATFGAVLEHHMIRETQSVNRPAASLLALALTKGTLNSVPLRRRCPAFLSALSFKLEKGKGFVGLMVGGDDKAVVVHVPGGATDAQLEAVRDEVVASLEKAPPCASGLARPLVVQFTYALPKSPPELERLALLLNVVDVQTSLPRE